MDFLSIFTFRVALNQQRCNINKAQPLLHRQQRNNKQKRLFYDFIDFILFYFVLRL